MMKGWLCFPITCSLGSLISRFTHRSKLSLLERWLIHLDVISILHQAITSLLAVCVCVCVSVCLSLSPTNSLSLHPPVQSRGRGFNHTMLSLLNIIKYSPAMSRGPAALNIEEGPRAPRQPSNEFTPRRDCLETLQRWKTDF